MKTLKSYTIKGIIFVSVLGTLLHFAYDLSGGNFIVGLFTPVNESTWEHTKLIFFPMLIFSLFTNKELKSHYPCISSLMILSSLIGVVSIITLFYTYSGIIGFNVSFIDIAVFYISVISSFLIMYKLVLSCKADKYRNILQISAMVGVCLYIIFTLYPPYIPLFISP